jgi:hypothetical protein
LGTCQGGERRRGAHDTVGRSRFRDDDRLGARDARLHGAGTSLRGRGGAGRALRRIRPRRDALRDTHGRPAVSKPGEGRVAAPGGAGEFGGRLWTVGDVRGGR